MTKMGKYDERMLLVVKVRVLGCEAKKKQVETRA